MLTTLNAIPPNIKQYLIVTGNYWVFTLTDGALRMLVVLHFHQLGYNPIAIASLFVFYEFFGILTNLFGGWLGATWGLNRTMNIGMLLQITALSLLLAPSDWLTVIWVMAAQALSGIAKDLNKMSAKSAIKTLVPKNHDTPVSSQENQLYRWVAYLTGSKNALKGVGFFLGGFLLIQQGFRGAIFTMVIALCLTGTLSIFFLKQDLGKSKRKIKINELFSKSTSINYLSAARFFLFGARDVWFVVAAPVAMASQFGWSSSQVGTFFALWVVLYGITQAFTPKLLGREKKLVTSKVAYTWVVILCTVMILLTTCQLIYPQWQWGLVIGLFIFGAVFAVNSTIHSYLIVSYSRADGTSIDVGFYYMANAAGRLAGTILSGVLFQTGGLLTCLTTSTLLLFFAIIITKLLCKKHQSI